MPFVLEDFLAKPEHSPPAQPTFDPETLEAEKSASYEQGYTAGWDDAVRADADNQARIGNDFARHLQEMSFTFHEARAHVLAAMEPLLDEIVATFLPEVVRDTMGQRLVQTLEPIIVERADQPVIISVAPGRSGALQAYLDEALNAVVHLKEDETLSDGQAFLRLGKVERKIDLTDALAKFRRSINALNTHNEKVLVHG